MSLTDQSEDIDWSVVLNHPRIKRKYGPRTNSSTSSIRSSISSGLTEQFSSSSSDSSSLEGIADFRSDRKDENASPGPLGKVRYTLAKRRAKKLFLRFTTPSRKNHRVPAWRRRKEAAEGLLQIVSREPEGEDLVGRRFTKTASRQESATRAILALGDEEYERNADSSGLWPNYAPLTVNDADPTARLLEITIACSKGSSFFEDSLPRALENRGIGSAAVLYLATSFSRFLERTDPQVLLAYAIRIMRWSHPSMISWLRAARLFDVVVSRISPVPAAKRDSHLSMAGVVTKQIVNILAPSHPNEDDSVTDDPHALWLAILLQTGITAFLQAEDNYNDLRNLFPPPQALERYLGVLERIITARFPTRTGLRSIERALALKSRALLRVVSAGKDGRPERRHSELGASCMQIVLSKPDQNGEWTGKGERDDMYRVWLSHLRVEEDAFDILCHLPEPVFAEALASELKAPTSKLDSHTEDVFQLLDPLLWLSNMPSDVKAAHRALVDGGTCNFLAKIVNYPVSPTWVWQDRDIWRAKGQAMTCLGNIIERMDGPQIRGHVTKEMIDCIVAIKTNEEAPLAQRDQAKFALQRYTAVADRCGIEPYYREKAQATDKLHAV